MTIEDIPTASSIPHPAYAICSQNSMKYRSLLMISKSLESTNLSAISCESSSSHSRGSSRYGISYLVSQRCGHSSGIKLRPPLCSRSYLWLSLASSRSGTPLLCPSPVSVPPEPLWALGSLDQLLSFTLVGIWSSQRVRSAEQELGARCKNTQPLKAAP